MILGMQEGLEKYNFQTFQKSNWIWTFRVVYNDQLGVSICIIIINRSCCLKMANQLFEM